MPPRRLACIVPSFLRQRAIDRAWGRASDPPRLATVPKVRASTDQASKSALFFHLFTHSMTVPDQIEHLGHYRFMSPLYPQLSRAVAGLCVPATCVHSFREATRPTSRNPAIHSHPPKCATLILWHTAQCTLQRLLHLLRRGSDIVLAHPFQQALLILAAQHFEIAIASLWAGRLNTSFGNCTSRLG